MIVHQTTSNSFLIMKAVKFVLLFIFFFHLANEKTSKDDFGKMLLMLILAIVVFIESINFVYLIREIFQL